MNIMLEKITIATMKNMEKLAHKIFFILKRLIFIRKVLNEYKPNLVLSFGFFYSNLFVSLVSLKRSYKVVLSVRNSNIYRLSPIMRTLSWFFYRRMDATHVITKNAKYSLIFRN